MLSVSPEMFSQADLKSLSLTFTLARSQTPHIVLDLQRLVRIILLTISRC